MSKPDNNWEVHWQETMAGHEAGPPSDLDWGGMEQLLDATAVSIQPEPAAGSLPTLSSLSWPVWAIALISLLALVYWLGYRTAGITGQEKRVLSNQQVSTNITSTVTTSSGLTEALPTPKTNDGEESPIDTQKSNFFPKPGPAINTPETAGGPLRDAPPATFTPAKKDTTIRFLPSPEPSGGVETIPKEVPTAPAFPPPAATKQRSIQKYRGIRPLKILALPTNDEIWKQKVDEILQAKKIIALPPSRINNGHFPAYRRWN